MYAIQPRAQVYNPEDGTWDVNDPEWEMTFWPRILFCDPGQETGVACVWFHPSRLLNPKVPTVRSILAWWVGFLNGPENDQARIFLQLCRGLGGPEGLAVGMEKFVALQANSQESFLSPVRIAAKIDFGLAMGIRDWDDVLRKRALVWQSPTDVGAELKGGFPQLRGMHLYTPGRDHRNAAMAHAVLHLRRMKNGGVGDFQRLYGWHDAWRD